MNSYFVPRKLTVRNSVMQIGNNTSKTEASIQSRTALTAREMENLVTDQLEAAQPREHIRENFWVLQQVRDEDVSIKQEEKRANVATIRKKKANRCFCTTIWFESQDWYSTGHGSHSPLPDDGDKSMMDLAQSLQTLGVHASGSHADVVRTYTDLV